MIPQSKHQDRMAYYYDEVEYSQPTIKIASAPANAIQRSAALAGLPYDAVLAARPAASYADLVGGLRLVRSSVRYESDPETEAEAANVQPCRVPAFKVKYYRRVRRPSPENVAIDGEQVVRVVRRAPQLVSDGIALVESYPQPTRVLSRAKSQGPPVAIRDINLAYYDTRDVIRENNNYAQLNKTIVTNVNRHHVHTIRVIDNTNNYNTHVTNHIIKVNDIHHQRTEHVKGETREFNDVKETQTVENAKCVNASCAAEQTRDRIPSREI